MPRARRWAKRLGLVILELFVVLTAASVVYNLATAHRIKPATALYRGPFVRVGGTLVAYRDWGSRGTPVVLLGGFIVPSSVWDGRLQAQSMPSRGADAAERAAYAARPRASRKPRNVSATRPTACS